MTNYKQNCLTALQNFIQEATNENKLELYVAYEEIEEEDKRMAELGQELVQVFSRILYQNQHDDTFLYQLKALYF